jgi:hypothetical protein
MRLLTRMLRKTIVLGLAGLGAYKAWELVSANFDGARKRAARVTGRLESVVRQAETEMKDASHDAATTLLDASRIAVAEVAETVADVALGESAPTETQPTSNTA